MNMSSSDIKMFQPSVCRICLATDKRLISISGTPLQLVFEKITNNRLHIDKWPSSACYICYAELKRCHRLILTTNSAGKMLVEMLEKYPEVTMEAVAKLHRPQLYALDITPTEYYDLTAPWSNEGIKTESECEVDKESKIKDSQGFSQQPDQRASDVHKSDEDSKTLSQSCGLVMNLKVEEASEEGSQQHADAMVVIPDHDQDDTSHEIVTAREIDVGRETSAEQRNSVSNQCHVCRRLYSRRDHLLRHLRANHGGEKPHECDFCKQRFSRKDYYLTHLKKHMGLQQSADAMVVTPDPNQDLTAHHNGTSLETVVGRETCAEQSDASNYQCYVCKRDYYRRDHLLRHLRTTHSGEKPHECDVCKRRFNRKDHYLTHLRTHTGEKPFECDVCQRKFGKKFILRCHYRTHTGEKPYECDICQRRFAHKCLLLHHLKTHKGKELFQCRVCPSRFDQKNTLDTHLLTHTAEKPFVCDICQRGFYQKGNLFLHIKTHTADESLDCGVCLRNFSTKSDLLSHSKIHTNERPYKCSDCQTGFKRVADLKRHMLVHITSENPYKCEVCHCIFTRKRTLVQHLKSH